MEHPDICLNPIDGHWYVVTYGRARWEIHAPDCTVTISGYVENRYENGECIVTDFSDVEIPCPADESGEDFHNWQYEHIFALTGTGRTKGDAYYDVVITECTIPSWVGRVFEFGY